MSQQDGDLEIEVKFHLIDLNHIRQRIVELKGRSEGRIFEKNIRFDSHSEELRRSSALLRLRQDLQTRLTLKSTPPESDDQFKVHHELEVTVSDFGTMRRMLHALGYEHEQIYEKWRETFIVNRIILCLDSMPYGDFLELEGDRDQIIRTAAQLGLDWRKRILTNYLEIFQTVKHAMQLAFDDVTFENFKKIDPIPADFMQRFEAG
jgi:adenylate cyclase class 2